MRISSFLCWLGVLAVILASSALVNAAKTPDTPDAVKIKPDVVVRDVSINKISSTPTGDNVRVSVTVANMVGKTSTGPFKVKVEWTEDPTVGFAYLGEGGVTNLANSPASAVAIQTKVLNFDHVVPKGKNYKYRATADYMNQVDEGDETNNVNSAGYVAR